MISMHPPEDEAEKWLSLQLSGKMSDAQKAHFKAWLATSEKNSDAYQQLSQLWGELDWNETLNCRALCIQSAPQKTHTQPRSTLSGRHIAAGIGLLAACFGLTVFLAPSPSPLTELASVSRPKAAEMYQTALGEIRTFTLEDGSEITLAAQSRLEVQFSDSERMAKLLEGDGYFSISPSPDRPFVVQTDQMIVRVLGTEFEINNKAGRGLVSVMEGSVEVTTPNKAQKAILTGGQRAIAKDGGLETTSFDLARIASWRDLRLSFLNTTLGDLVTEVNRYHAGGIYLASPDLHDMQVSTSFRTNQVDTAISGIALSLGLDTIRTETGAIILRQPSGQK